MATPQLDLLRRLALSGPWLPACLRKSAGEGSRGGKILGHTRSGKPIYAKRGGLKLALGHGYSGDDHKDASVLHYHTYQMHHAAGRAAEEATENDDLSPSVRGHFEAKAAHHRRLADRHEKLSDWHDNHYAAALKAEDDDNRDAFEAINRRQGVG